MKPCPWSLTFLSMSGYSAYIGNSRGQGNWSGYMEEDYSAGKPARYLCPIHGSAINASGKDKNGSNILVNYYGFKNEE